MWLLRVFLGSLVVGRMLLHGWFGVARWLCGDGTNSTIMMIIIRRVRIRRNKVCLLCQTKIMKKKTD